MQRSTSTSLSTFVIVGLAALLLTGCGSSPSDESSTAAAKNTQPDTTTSDEKPATGSEGEAVLSLGDTTYSAQLKFCALNGTEDALFHGVAYDEAGNEIGYLDGDFGGLDDSPHGEARIDFGATSEFQSKDEFVAMGTVAGHIVITDFSETDLIVMGGAWDQAGTQLPTATLKVTC